MKEYIILITFNLMCLYCLTNYIDSSINEHRSHWAEQIWKLENKIIDIKFRSS